MAYSDYNSAVVADAPLIRYTFESGISDTGSLAASTSTNSPSRNAAFAAAYSAAGITLDGSIDYVTNNSTNDYMGDKAFAVEAWFKTDATGGNYKTIVRKSYNASHFILRVRGNVGLNDGKLECYFSTDSWSTSIVSTNRVDDNQWHHVVISANGGGSQLIMYVDGVNTASVSIGSGVHSTPVATWIGRDFSNGTPGELFKGQLDEIAIYQNQLTSARVLAHYNAAAAPPPVNMVWNADVPTLSLTGVDFSAVDTTKNISLDLPTVTASLSGVDAAVRISKTTDVETPTLSAQAHEVMGVFTDKNVDLVASRDFMVADNVTYEGQPNIVVGSGSSVFDFELPADFTNTGKDQVLLTLNKEYVQFVDGVFHAYAITQEYANGAKTFVTNQNGITFTPDSTLGKFSIDVTELVTKPNFYGILITSANTDEFIRVTSSEGAIADRPTLSLKYRVVSEITAVDVDTPNINFVVTNADAGGYVATTVETPTVSAQANDVEVDTFIDPNVDLTVETALVSLQAPEADPVIPMVLDLSETPGQTLNAEDVSVDVSQGQIIDLDTPKILTTHYQLTDVNGEPIAVLESEDPYFESTMRTFLDAYLFGISGGTAGQAAGGPMDPNSAYWYRLSERSGDRFFDRASEPRDTSGLINHGATIGLTNGPEGRHNISFNGDAWIEQPQSITGDETGIAPTSLEFTFKTDKPNQFIMGGADMSYGLNTNPLQPWELWMVDGVLEIRQYSSYVGNYREGMAIPYTTTRMRTNVADGEWHHIVIQRAHLSTDERASATDRFFAFEAYLDGRLEMRRRVGHVAAGFPDYIGGKPNQYYRAGQWTMVGSSLAGDQWFDGEMTELVFRLGNVISEDEITLQRDNVMAIDVYRPSAARMTLTTNDAVAKGNKARLLILDFGVYRTRPQNREERLSKFTVEYKAQSALEYADWVNAYGEDPKEVAFDFPGWGEQHIPNVGSTFGNDVMAFRQFVAFNANGSQLDYWHDEVTDNYRLIDLENDINMDDYDLISIVGFPRNDQMWSVYDGIDDRNLPGAPTMRNELERVMGQIREQVVSNRKSLYISDPFSAMALGIINDVEYVPDFREFFMGDQRLGANIGGLDFFAYTSDPFTGAYPGRVWGVDRPLPYDEFNFMARLKEASGYEDTHANIHHRVRNVVNGLTTQMGWYQTDELRWWNVNPFGLPPQHISKAFKYGPAGYGIAPNVDFLIYGWNDYDQYGWGFRGNGWVATPMSAINVGKAVTTFSPTIRVTPNIHLIGLSDDPIGGQSTAFDYPLGNPYADYATSIAVETGDVWNGEYVSGKVYVGFTEAYAQNPEGTNDDEIMPWTDMESEYPYEPGHQGDDGTFSDKVALEVGDDITTNNNYEYTITPEMKKFQFSTHYGQWNGTEVEIPQTRGSSGADWGWAPGGSRNAGTFNGGMSGGAGYAMQWHFRAATAFTVNIPVPTMAQRGLKWLTTDLDISGNANVFVDTAEVTTKANDVTVDTVKNDEVVLRTASISLESYSDADTIDPDVSVLVSSPAITVSVIGLTEIVELDTPSITVNAVADQPVDYEIDWTQALVFTLPRQGLTLTMEEA